MEQEKKEDKNFLKKTENESTDGTSVSIENLNYQAKIHKKTDDENAYRDECSHAIQSAQRQASGEGNVENKSIAAVLKEEQNETSIHKLDKLTVENSDTVRLRFVIYVTNKENDLNQSSLAIVFFTHSNRFQLSFECYSINEDILNAKTALSRYDVLISMPLELIDEPTLSYTYFYTKYKDNFIISDINYIYERDATDNTFHRKLPEFLTNEIKNYQNSSCKTNNEITLYEGLVLFNTYEESEMKEFNSECFAKLLNINGCNFDEVEKVCFMIEKYKRIHKCLAEGNKNNKDLFIEILKKEMKNFQSEIKQPRVTNDFLKGLVFFYLYNNYELDAEDILTLVCDPTKHEYFDYLKNLSTYPPELKEEIKAVFLKYFNTQCSKTAFLAFIHYFNFENKDYAITRLDHKNNNPFHELTSTVLSLQQYKYTHEMHLNEFSDFKYLFDQSQIYNTLFLSFFSKDLTTLQKIFNSKVLSVNSLVNFLYFLTKTENLNLEFFEKVIKTSIEFAREKNAFKNLENASELIIIQKADFIYNQIKADAKLNCYWLILLNLIELNLVISENCIRFDRKEWFLYNKIENYIRHLHEELIKNSKIEDKYGTKEESWKSFVNSIECKFMYEQYFYNHLASINIKDFVIANSFTEFIRNLVRNRLKMSEINSIINVRSNLKRMNLVNDFHELFDELIQRYIINVDFRDSDGRNEVNLLIEAFQNEPEALQLYFGALIRMLKENSDMNLKFILIYIFYKGKKLNLKVLTDEDYNFVIKVIKGYLERIKRIMKGDVLIETLENMHPIRTDLIKKIENLIIDNEDELACLRENAFFETVLQFRLKELDEFNLYKESMNTFLEWCDSESFKFLSDLSACQRIMSEVNRSYEKSSLNKFVKVCNIEEIRDFTKDLNDYNPIVNFLKGINKEMLDKIIDINRLRNSSPVFLIEKLKEHVKNKISIEDFFDNTWIKCRNELKAFVDSIYYGNILLSAIEDRCALFEDNLNKMTREIEGLASHFNFEVLLENMEKREEQIKMYFEFKRSVAGAQLIEEIRVKNKIKEPFSQIEPLLNSNAGLIMKKWKLTELDDNFLRTANFLSALSDSAKADCLKAFRDSFELVEWLRANTNDLASLKFLIDMIDTTTGDNEVKKITLYDVGTRYAPLIYGVTDSLEKFITNCEKVWLFLNDDDKIAAKISRLNSEENIKFLTGIKKKGDVETCSLEKAKNGNEGGRYIITNHKKLDFLSLSSIESLIELQIPTNKTNESDVKKIDDKYYKTLNYESIKTVKNILILSTRNIENEFDESKIIDYFVEVFDCVCRLAEIYLKLVQSGCDFFNNFKLTLNCDCNENYTKPILEFNVENYQFELDRKKATECLNYVCEYMEVCLKDWRAHLNDLRSTYDKMNYYTTSQLIFIKNTFKKIEKDSENVFEFEKLKFLLNKISGERFDRDRLTNLFTNVTYLIKLEKSDELKISTILQSNERDEWKNYMQNQTDETNEEITMHRTAAILCCLTQNDKVFKRTVPAYLTQRGSNANLIMVPHNIDQITIALSIYATSPECPLPSNDEVLYCTIDTQCDEIESFLRIALMSNGDRIYTIIHVEKLDFEVSKHANKCFQTPEPNKDSVLVILSNDDKGAQSPVVSSFINIKIELPYNDQKTIEQIKIYMFNKLKEQHDQKLNEIDESSVRCLISNRPGCGKSRFIKNLKEKIKKIKMTYHYMPVKYRRLDKDKIVDELFNLLQKKRAFTKGHLFHIDIAYEVTEQLQHFLFNLIVLGVVRHRNGIEWKRSNSDVYFIEKTLAFNNGKPVHFIFDLIPSIFFRDPKTYLTDLKSNNANASCLDISFREVYKQDDYQCVCSYVRIWDDETRANKFKFYNTTVKNDEINEEQCLEIILNQLPNPTWMEINNYVRFLNEQLFYTDRCNTFDIIPGFKAIYLKCLKFMSQDIALPALNLNEPTSEQEASIIANDDEIIEEDLNKYSVKRGWTQFYHPFILFNANSTIQCTAEVSNKNKCFQLMGFYVNDDNYPVDPITLKQLDHFSNEIPFEIIKPLMERNYPVTRNFNEHGQQDRFLQIGYINEAFGLTSDKWHANKKVDESYVLTVDNCLKLMGIYMRFRANIPVVIMGETGCGKTRVIKFLADLHQPKYSENFKMLIHVKIHGGTTAQKLKEKLKEAEKLSQENYDKAKQFYPGHEANNKFNYVPVSAILFFDEANTTEAISLIKEIICDGTCEGESIDFSKGLKIIAACNPYRKHNVEMRKKIEKSGLGFFSDNSNDKFGRIPMRELVYRVQPLPPSLLPLVWDFGELTDAVEKDYIKKILEKASYIKFNNMKEEIELLSELLAKSQDFMRKKRDECSFVSLRDIERVLKVAAWFHSKSKLIFPKMKKDIQLNDLYRCFILALAVCYHASLRNADTRKEYRDLVAETFKIKNDNDWVLKEISECQHVFISQIELSKNIAKNAALLENVFMMIICVELRIPLFIIGKPGSSKSLAKTIVTGAMQGKNSNKELFQNLKGAFFVNFQCSPLTTPDMIVNAFNSAASIQKGKDLNETVAVVNLDEIGLAEASESMPLKALHPLLEEGTDSDEMSEPYQKVAVIGISNWALDPAKMNRGLIVSREEPDLNELIESAKGICNYNEQIFENIKPHMAEIADGYLNLYKEAIKNQREFFGLRDFYSLIKMLYWFCKRSSNHNLTWNKLEYAIKRNFSGLDIDPLESFSKLKEKLENVEIENELNCNSVALIHAALRGDNIESNSRYLLLISHNYSVLDAVQNYLIKSIGTRECDIAVIFGSSFPHDLHGTEISRNISKVRNCIELGKTVILLNFENVYESLYDALNQFYFEFGGQKYVDLGLGTHRVKCAVHDKFRLIIIADRRLVYDSKKFPIPLLNRLEKHCMSASSILEQSDTKLVCEIEKWLHEMCISASEESENTLTEAEIFIGYHEDTISNLVLCKKKENEKEDVDLAERIKKSLIQCATTDSLARILFSRKDESSSDYFSHLTQCNSSLRSILEYHVNSKSFSENNTSAQLIEVTTFSTLVLHQKEIENLKKSMHIPIIKHYALNSFNTQQQFVNTIQEFISIKRENERVECKLERMLIIQAHFGDAYSMDLIFCARHVIVDEFKKIVNKECVAIVLIVNICRENTTRFSGFQVSTWSCYHVDELEEMPEYLPSIESVNDNKQISLILSEYYENDLQKKRYLLEKCVDYACSLIKDRQINRTMNRIETLKKILVNDEFVKCFFDHLLKIQKQREKTERSHKMSFKNTTTLSSIKESITLRKSFSNYLITEILSPIIAYILSRIDAYSNLDLFNKTDKDYIKKLWINIFKTELLDLEYNNMVLKESNYEELKHFKCREENRFEDKAFKVPFLSTINTHIKQFIDDLKENNNFGNNMNEGIFKLFEQTPIYIQLNKSISVKDDKNDFFKKYCNALAQFIFEINLNESYLNAIEVIVEKLMPNNQNNELSTNLVLLHVNLADLNNSLSLFFKFTQSFPHVLKRIQMLSNLNEDTEFGICKICIRAFMNSLTSIGEDNLADRFSTKNFQTLVSMIQNYLKKNKGKDIDQVAELNNELKLLKIINNFLNEVFKKANKKLILSYLIRNNKTILKDMHGFLKTCLKMYSDKKRELISFKVLLGNFYCSSIKYILNERLSDEKLKLIFEKTFNLIGNSKGEDVHVLNFTSEHWFIIIKFLFNHDKYSEKLCDYFDENGENITDELLKVIFMASAKNDLIEFSNFNKIYREACSSIYGGIIDIEQLKNEKKFNKNKIKSLQLLKNCLRVTAFVVANFEDLKAKSDLYRPLEEYLEQIGDMVSSSGEIANVMKSFFIKEVIQNYGFRKLKNVKEIPELGANLRNVSISEDSIEVFKIIYDEVKPAVISNNLRSGWADMNNLIEHFRITMTNSASRCAKPLFNLMSNPSDMKEAFLPTMPRYNVLEILNDNIFNNLHSRGYLSKDENEIQTFSYHVMRFFIDLSCFIASDQHDIRDIFTSEAPEELKVFFWEKLCKTSEKIRKITLLSDDEFFIVMHSILKDIQTKSNNTDECEFDWHSFDKRLEWEKCFKKTFLDLNIKRVIKSCLEKLNVNDLNEDSKLLVTSLQNKTSPYLHETCFYASDKFWINKKPISLDSFFIDLQGQTNGDDFKFLKKFFELRYKLESFDSLYRIVRMVNELKKLFERLIFRKIASEKAVQLNRGQIIKSGIESLDSIWQKSKEQILNHALDNIPTFPRCASNIKNFHKDFSFQSKLSHLLPTKEGDGLTVYLIIHYLCSIHNELLSNCDLIDASQQINILNMNDENHFIKFDKESLLSIINANYLCDDMTSFNYKEIEEEILWKYFQNKKLVDITRMPEFEYAEDVMYDSIAVLNDVRQDFFDAETQKDIFEEYKEQSEICEAIHFLKSIINFVDNSLNDPDMLLNDFFNKYLGALDIKIDKVLKARTIQATYLKNIQHLWLILKTRQICIYAQDPKSRDFQFEILNKAFKVEIKSDFSFITKYTEVISLLIFTYQLISFVISSEFGCADELNNCAKISIIDYRSRVDNDRKKYLHIANYIQNIALQQLKYEPKMGNIADIFIKLIMHLKSF